jgi:hypothetical protein
MIRRLTRWRKAIWRFAKWPVRVACLILIPLLIPVGYVELACRGDATGQTYQPLITDATFQRREANTYLTYPEWHIVYAYDGLAETLKNGDEHAFDYISSVNGFWRSTCALMRVADAHGGADFDTRTMIHTIGISFTAEMAVKAAYEETIGRATAAIAAARKRRKTGRSPPLRSTTPRSCARLPGINIRSRARSASSGRRQTGTSFADWSDGSV